VPLFPSKFDIQGDGYCPAERPEQLAKQHGVIYRENLSYIDLALSSLI